MAVRSRHILITGGYGFISMYLANKLSKEGHYVRLATRNILSNECLEKRVDVFKIDWENTNSLRMACTDQDTVIHCAAISSSRGNFNYATIHHVNVHYTRMLREASTRCSVDNFIFISTSQVYNISESNIIDEYTPVYNSNYYAQTKIEAEDMLINNNLPRSHNLLIIRLSNCFGFPLKSNSGAWDLFVNNIVFQAVYFNKIFINNDAGLHRSFTPVYRLQKLVSAYLSGNIFPNQHDVIVNLGTRYSSSLNDVATNIILWIQEMTGRKLSLSSKITSEHKSFEYSSLYLPPEFVDLKFSELHQPVSKMFSRLILDCSAIRGL